MKNILKKLVGKKPKSTNSNNKDKNFQLLHF